MFSINVYFCINCFFLWTVHNFYYYLFISHRPFVMKEIQNKSKKSKSRQPKPKPQLSLPSINEQHFIGTSDSCYTATDEDATDADIDGNSSSCFDATNNLDADIDSDVDSMMTARNDNRNDVDKISRMESIEEQEPEQPNSPLHDYQQNYNKEASWSPPPSPSVGEYPDQTPSPSPPPQISSEKKKAITQLIIASFLLKKL